MNGDNIKVSVNETKEEYRFEASFNKDKSDAVSEYMDDYLDQKIFENAQVDAAMRLNDGTQIYVKTDDGEVKIRLDKQLNSRESYEKIKKMGEGIKRILTKK
ncbi:hypothetical protein GCM10011514_01990 [Emticicia aquatilis]|uniref:Uncharacterized protein n=2 Tax=Emticicia aquatilis TaxID=1537369 RepID=A0A917DJ86_9BACT|nr:hypothetical protein GCM10011514_01990 [Emticicia aquatilis]